MIRTLSYPLSANTPLFADNPPVEIWPQFSTDKGDVFNQYFIKTINHNGTHMDGPRHFNPKGKCLYELPIETFIFHAPAVLELHKDPDSLIEKVDLEPFAKTLAAVDLAIFRTGHGAYRASNPSVYGNHNPGFAESAGEYLMGFPNLRAIGMDVPSAAGAQNIEQGIRFHQVVLGKDRLDDRAILIIEDMDLRESLLGLQSVYAIPLLIEGVDSCPCTILAHLKTV